jgi:hypothetical protein
MATKKKVTKKKPDVNIQVRNLDKLCKDKKNKKWCGTGKPCGNCWIFGSALAMILSYTQNSSILYAILHGVLSWFYVLFRAMQIWGWF